MAECRSCHAPIRWAVTDSGKRMPVDRDPVPGGNVALVEADGDVRAVVLGSADVLKPEFDNGLRYTSHFVTCPEAPQHRRGR